MYSRSFSLLSLVGAALAAPHTNRLHSRQAPVAGSADTNQPAPPATIGEGEQRFVVVHHMVGNTFPYTVTDWEDDIKLANANGIDGFALNAGRDDFQTTQVANAYQAAQNTGLPFKLFMSFDMSSFECATPDDAATLRKFITDFATHPNQFVFGSPAKPFASTFAGESCTFGQADFQSGWDSQFKQLLENGGPGVFFVPAFFTDPATIGGLSFTDGDFQWNSAWPIDIKASNLVNNTDDARAALTPNVGSFDPDSQHLAVLQSGKTYMGNIAPWFFTHFPAPLSKNFVFLTDEHLFARRWEAVVANRDKIQLAEIATWNDYGESHYIGPIKGALPTGSEVWTNGNDHQVFLKMTNYYATAYKTGSYPQITQDQLFMWARPHSRDAQASGDALGPPTSFELFTDAMWAVAFATAPGQVIIQTNPTTSQTFDIPAGVSKLKMPIVPGDTMSGKIVRDGNVVASVDGQGFAFSGSPTTLNFNIFTASSN